MIKGRRVYDPLTNTYSTGWWIVDDKGNYYPVWQKGAVMERLTERNPLWINDEMWLNACEPDDEEIEAIYRRLKDYEDLEEQGRLSKLPCKDVYSIVDINNPKYAMVMKKAIRELMIYEIEDIDKSGCKYFSTKEKAEAKLKELRGGENGSME